MKFFCSLLIALVALLFASVSLQAAPYDPPTWRDSTWDYRSEDPGDTTELSIAKGVGVASTVLIAYGAAYWLVFHKGWWDEQGNDFHFENDFDYALNLDKLGHFASGVMMGETFYEAYRWAGISEFNSYLFAGLSAFATHVAIDVKDGFAPKWGFSVFDVLSGTLGGFLPMAERYVPVFKYVDLKWSYWINSKAYYRQSDTGVFTDDPHPHREVYIALDYDLEAFRPQSRMARTIVKYLNYFKLPAPTVQVYPEFHWYLLYPIKF